MNLLRHVVDRPAWVLLAHLVLVAAMLPGIVQLEADNTPATFFAKGDDARTDQAKLRLAFPSTGELRIVIGGDGLFTHEGLSWVARLESGIATLPGVGKITGPASVARWREPSWPPGDIAAARNEIAQAAAGLLRGWVSPDGTTLSLLLELDDTANHATLASIQQRLSPPAGIDVHLTGLPVIQQAVDQSIRAVFLTTLPAIAILSALALVIAFRRFQAAVGPLCLVGFCEVLLFGIMGYAGASINLISAVIAPLLFVIALATAVHVWMHFHMAAPAKASRVESTMRAKTRPILWTGATTAIAFGSLAASQLPAVAELGLWCALGMAILTIAMFTLFPALMALNASTGQARLVPLASLGRGMVTVATRHPTRVAVGSLLVFAAALLSIPRLQVGDDVATALAPRHPVTQSILAVTDKGMGAFPIEILLERPEMSLRNPDALAALAMLSQQLRDDPRVAASFGAGDMVEAALDSIVVDGDISESTRWMALAMLQSDPASKELLDSFLSKGGDAARLVVMVPPVEPANAAKLRQDFDDLARQALPDAEVSVAGDYLLVLLGQRHLLSSMVKSFLGTLAGVALAIMLFVRRPGRGSLVLLANVLPVAMVIGGVAWWTGIADSALVMTASILLGLAVDDTFHILHQWQSRHHGETSATAITDGVSEVAPANILTSVIVGIGFLVCLSSSLQAVSRFGVLMAAGACFTLLCDLVVLPALLVGRRQR